LGYEIKEDMMDRKCRTKEEVIHAHKVFAVSISVEAT
jgi:hypothetical protein